MCRFFCILDVSSWTHGRQTKEGWVPGTCLADALNIATGEHGNPCELQWLAVGVPVF